MFETDTTDVRQERVRNLETIGGRERSKDGGSTIRDVSWCDTVGH